MKEWETCAQFRAKRENKDTVHQGSPNFSPQVKSGPRSHSNRLMMAFHRAA